MRFIPSCGSCSGPMRANWPSAPTNLETGSSSMNGRRMFFAGAKIKKNYVSFYLPALYMFPDLSDRISPSLKKTMQGQACFNLTIANPDWFEELGRLTQAGYQKLKSEMLL